MRFLGLCSFFGVSRQMEVSLGMSMAVIFVMTISSAVTWILYHVILLPLNVEFLKISTFILVIASLVQLEELFLKRHIPHLYRALEIAPIPEPLKGYPTAFFIAALMSLAFLGFKGLFGL